MTVNWHYRYGISESCNKHKSEQSKDSDSSPRIDPGTSERASNSSASECPECDLIYGEDDSDDACGVMRDLKCCGLTPDAIPKYFSCKDFYIIKHDP